MLVMRHCALVLLATVLLLHSPHASAATGYSFVEGYNVLDEGNSPGIGALLGATAGLERDIAVDATRGIIYQARGLTTTADRGGGVIGIAAIVVTNGALPGSNFRDTGLIAGGNPVLGWCQSLAYDAVSDRLWVLGGPLNASPNIYFVPGGTLGGAPGGGNPAAVNAALTRAFTVDTNLLDVGVYVSTTVSTNGVPSRGGAPRGFAVRTVGTNTTVYLGMGNHVQAWSNAGTNGWQRIWATQRPPAGNTVATRVALTGFNGVNGLAVDDDGNCYFSVQNTGGRIWTVRPSLIEFVADPMSLDYNDLAFGGSNERDILPLIIENPLSLLATPPQGLTFARFDAQRTLFASFLPATASRGVTRLDIDNGFSVTNDGAYIRARAIDGFGSGQPAGGQDTILSTMRLKQSAAGQPQGTSNGTLYHDVDSVTNPTYLYCQAFVIDTNKGQTVPTAAVIKVRIASDTNPPSIFTQPLSQTLLEGGTINLSVGAAGARPLHYQWQTNDVDIPGANSPAFVVGGASTNQAGAYRVVVTNALGATNSLVANVTVNPLVRSAAMTLLWSNAPGSRPYITSDSTQRGLTYNPDSLNLLVVSRTPSNAVYVLNSETGEDVGQLGLSGVSGGTFAVSKIGASDGGPVFVANLAQNGQDFRIYRWTIEVLGDSPALAYSGNPTGSATNRWGDTFDVRGAGNNIQILAGTRASNVFAIFTTTDGGDTFTAHPITVAGAGANAFGLGLAFGTGNTVWAKGDGSTPLRLVEFDLGAGTGTVLQSYSAAQFTSAALPLAVQPDQNLLASISIENPDNLRLYTTFNLANPPVLIDQEQFPTDNANDNFAGALDFGGDKLFALDTQNGLLAMSIGTIAVPPGAITITRTNNTVYLNWEGNFTLQSSTNVVGPYIDIITIGSGHTESTVGVPEKYFRLRN
jgi:hypothetical protein